MDEHTAVRKALTDYCHGFISKARIFSSENRNDIVRRDVKTRTDKFIDDVYNDTDDMFNGVRQHAEYYVSVTIDSMITNLEVRGLDIDYTSDDYEDIITGIMNRARAIQIGVNDDTLDILDI